MAKLLFFYWLAEVEEEVKEEKHQEEEKSEKEIKNKEPKSSKSKAVPIELTPKKPVRFAF